MTQWKSNMTEQLAERRDGVTEQHDGVTQQHDGVAEQQCGECITFTSLIELTEPDAVTLARESEMSVWTDFFWNLLNSDLNERGDSNLLACLESSLSYGVACLFAFVVPVFVSAACFIAVMYVFFVVWMALNGQTNTTDTHFGNGCDAAKCCFYRMFLLGCGFVITWWFHPKGCYETMISLAVTAGSLWSCSTRACCFLALPCLKGALTVFTVLLAFSFVLLHFLVTWFLSTAYQNSLFNVLFHYYHLHSGNVPNCDGKSCLIVTILPLVNGISIIKIKKMLKKPEPQACVLV